MGRKLMRVPLDFDWPLKETWIGYLNPYWSLRKECECRETGLSPTARIFSGQWYGNEPFYPVVYGVETIAKDAPGILALANRNRISLYGEDNVSQDAEQYERREASRLWGFMSTQWCHHLNQDDVDALVAANRLLDFTHNFVPGEGWMPRGSTSAVTADEVNAWSIGGMGHDSLNQYICVRARCERERVPHLCSLCEGHGHIWPSKMHQRLYNEWKTFDPPAGDGFQLWETTSEGSPASPVFRLMEELCVWCADNATTFAHYKATADEWREMLDKDFVHHKSPLGTFI